MAVGQLVAFGCEAHRGAVIPRHIGCGGSGCSTQFGDTGACGSQFESKVVEVCCPAGTQRLHGHIGAIAGVEAERHLVFLPVGAATHIDGAHLHKGVDIVGVGHHAHLECGTVASAGSLGPEAQLKSTGGIGVRIHWRQYHDLIVAIGASGGSVVPIETFAATRRMVVGGAVAHVWVATVAGAVVEMAPTVDERTSCGTRTCGSILKVVEERQSVQVGTCGTLHNG